jgi:DNA-binding NarL/FixJ family response regulator
MMKIRIVVAEDFPLVREAVVRALSHDPGLEVVGEATTGIEAIELAETLLPDVLLLDMVMPGLGGLEVLHKLRTSHPQIRIVVLTASEEAGTLLDAIAAGAAGYLSKRAVGEELRQAVITAHGGGSVITPTLARHLLNEYSSSARGEPSNLRPLQGRELDVVRLVAAGKTDNEIGQQLDISARTVQNYLTSIRAKTGLRRRAELTRWAVQHAIA